jgi:hypothetical protein
MMAQQLTYADRELLLQTFDILRAEWNGEDERLLTVAHDWAKQLVPSCGFEHSLTRDVTTLSKYLLAHKSDNDIAEIARGGLLYLTLANQNGPSKLGDMGLLDEAFISSYAVHEIRTRLGEQTIYNPPRLTQDEQKHAESLFLELAEQPLLGDNDLIEKSRTIGEGLANLATCGLFRRLQRNIDFLISVLNSSNHSHEQQCYARAALSYLICEEDAIDDRLGIVGYLDDNFIVQMAVDMIEPARDPWLDLLDATVGAWPFLNTLVIDDGSGGRPISEYMIINSALSCGHLRGEQSGSTALILPFTGPTSFLLGFIATLGLVQQSGQRDVTEKSFFFGQKVLVDNQAIAEFADVKEIDGRRRFGLTQYRNQQGQRLKSTRYWPISDLRRVVPADMSRVTRGQLTQDLSKSDVLLPALEYLFNANRTAHLAAVSRKTLVVTSVTSADNLAKRMRLYGHSLKEVVPMGHLTDTKIKPWSNRFGQQEPLLVFVSDLDIACAYAEENIESIDLVIIDAVGRNANKAASLGEMRNLNLRTLVVMPERAANELPVTGSDFADVWEWDVHDFSALVWPKDHFINGLVARYERRLQTLPSSDPQVKNITYPLADESFESVRQLKLFAKQHGEDSLAELDELIVVAFGIMSRLLRLAAPLKNNSPSFLEIEQGIKRMGELHHNSIYLSAAERSAANNTEKLLKQFFDDLKINNPKAAVVQELLRTQPNLSIICPDARTLVDLEYTYASAGVRILNDYDDSDELDIHGAIIPGWFGKDRMANLLIPPVTQPLLLVLYGIEHRWQKTFVNNHQRHKKTRTRGRSRSKLFPTLQGWAERTIKQSLPPEAADSSLQEMEAIQDHILVKYRQRAYRTAKSDGSEAEVSARLVMFEGNAYAFLRESFKANVVTHLLDAAYEGTGEDNMDVQRKTVKELKVGDALLFHRRSGRDVIRLTADKEMPAGMRETATLWQKALINYALREGISYKDVWQRLKQAGCTLHHQTIRIWMEDEDMIAPRQYEQDVRIIAKVTNDPQLNSQIETVLNAINTVFGAHQRASHKLAFEVLHRAIEILKEERRQAKLIEIEPDIVIVRIIEIDNSDTPVRVSIANRLQDPDQWLA